MYINQIKFDSCCARVFLTSEELFTPFSPKFKAIQESLIKMGFKEIDNHSYEIDNKVLKFVYDETDFLNLRTWQNSFPANVNGYYTGELSLLISNIYYVLKNDVDVNTIDEIMNQK